MAANEQNQPPIPISIPSSFQKHRARVCHVYLSLLCPSRGPTALRFGWHLKNLLSMRKNERVMEERAEKNRGSTLDPDIVEFLLAGSSQSVVLQ